MAGRRGGKGHQDGAVSVDLGDLIDERRDESPEFAAALRDTQERHELLKRFVTERKRRGLNQTDVANEMSTTQSAISEMEQGTVEPRLSTLQRYARMLGLRLRFRLVAEPVGAGFYTDRSLKSPPASRIRPDSRQLPDEAEVEKAASVNSATLSNVTHVNFQRQNETQLASSLAARFEAKGTA